jgi:hypothetical protein
MPYDTLEYPVNCWACVETRRKRSLSEEAPAAVVNMEPNPILCRVRLLELVGSVAVEGAAGLGSFVTAAEPSSVSRLFRYSGKAPLILYHVCGIP